MSLLIVRNGMLALPGRDEPLRGDLAIRDGVVAEVGGRLPNQAGAETVDADGFWVFPGGIDPHVHFDDPGYTHREDFSHGTAAAASGGITTVIDMPCTSVPPVTNLANLREKLAAVSPKAHVDFAFFGGVSGQVMEGDAEEAVKELAPYVRGVKAYATSGMESFRRLGPYELERLLAITKAAGLPVLLHAEDHDYVDSATRAAMARGRSPFEYYRSRPELAELLSIQAAALIAARLRADLHVVHLGVAKGALILEQAGLTAETCPQYLEFDLEDFMEIGSPLKIAPPVKRKQKDRLWDLLAAGKISFVSSDHAPAPREEKYTGSVWTDYGGIPGTGTLWPYLYSEGFRKGRLTLSRFLRAVSENAAKRYGLWNRKGSIEKGKDADLLIVDPASSWTVEGAKFLSKGRITPFEGRVFAGLVRKTFVRGRIVWDSEEGLVGQPGWGRFLPRTETA